MNPITINQLQLKNQLPNIKQSTKTSGSFSNTLSNAVEQLNQSQLNSQQDIQNYINGKSTDLHNVMIAVEKSSIMLQTAVQVRDKAVQAYQEIMRMQV